MITNMPCACTYIKAWYKNLCGLVKDLIYQIVKIFLWEVKTCIALVNRKIILAGYSSAYIYTILQFILPFRGPLLYACLSNLISSSSCTPLGYVTEHFPIPFLTPSYPCYDHQEVSATCIPSCFETLVSLFSSLGMTWESLTSTSKHW